MKKPIDEFLTSQEDELDELLDLAEEKAEDLFEMDDVPVVEKVTVDEALTLSEKDIEHRHHHHHHHSDGEHHHSSSEHHHSGSEHHSSGSEHHHSDGEHRSSDSRKHSKKKKKKEKKLSLAAKLAIAILALLLALVLAVVGTFGYLEHQGKRDLITVTKQENFDETIEYNGHKYVYNNNIVAFAFMGIDKRDLGTEGDIVGTGGQADACIVAAVDISTGKITAIAIPRDTMVEVDLYSPSGVPLRTETMQLCLSHAYGDGKETSAQNVMTSISRILLNVPIEKYFSLDLNGIAPINDAIGGVDVEAIYDIPNFGIRKGEMVHLEGDMTEAYVRTRSLDSIEASLNRTQRQVQYIKAFAAQLVPAVTKDFSTVSKLYYTAQNYSSTNISVSNATYFASTILSKGVDDFETITLQGEMKPSDNIDTADFVYAEFYPDKEALYDTVLSTFYNQID